MWNKTKYTYVFKEIQQPLSISPSGEIVTVRLLQSCENPRKNRVWVVVSNITSLTAFGNPPYPKHYISNDSYSHDDAVALAVRTPTDYADNGGQLPAFSPFDPDGEAIYYGN